MRRLSLHLAALFLTILLLAATLMLIPALAPAQGAEGDTAFTNVIATNLVTQGYVSVGSDLNLFKTATLSVTNGLTITANSYQPLSSAGTVTITLAAKDAGDIVVLENTTNTTINMTDAGNRKLTAAWAGGQFDSIVLIFDGTNWIELARANN
jgi:hypothetical protein